MRSNLLSVFRNGDGRSLGKAFAILYLVAAVIAAFGSGASAAMAMPGGVLCITGDSGKAPVPAPASGTHTQDCCLSGHAPTPAATPSTPAQLPARIAIAATTPVPTACDLPAYRHITAARPRGPPLDA